QLTLAEVSEPVLHERCALICERRGRIQADMTLIQDETDIVLHQDSTAPMTITRLIERVAEELHRQGHSYVFPNSAHRFVIGAKVLGMAAALARSGNPVECLNSIVAAISPTRVCQWAVLIAPSTGSEQYRFGDFVYGEIELEKLRYRCEKAGS